MTINSTFRSLVLLVASSVALASKFHGGLTIRTSTGTYTGLINPQYSNVREFRSIPYAKPPTGSLRWLPPDQLSPSTEHHYSTIFPPSCPQYFSAAKSIWNQYLTDFLIYNGNENYTAGLSAQTTSEDCLKLAVWTPASATSNSSLPVLMFMTGGGFATGGIQIPYQLPPAWVARSQSHIVVTINYRVNIMGFPNAAGLQEQNIGILDQRAALEWLYSNIKEFGGDPEAITLWGQSAGSESTDYHAYAFYKNPIARALFMESGTALKSLSSHDFEQTNFTFVAQNFGCGFPNNSAAELDCMRQVPSTMIQNFVGQYQDSGATPGLSFGPIADEKVIFSNYPARAKAGYIAKIPAIISNCANEEATLYTYPVNNVTAGPYLPAVNAATLSSWICVSANTSSLRQAAGLETYRYQNAGNFSNLSPLWWMGAYHDSDLPMILGTYSIARGNGTEFEKEVSETIQDYLLAYISDPANGLKKLGWISYDTAAADGGTMLRFGADGKAAQNVTGLEVDGPCRGIGTYNPSP